MKAPKLPSVTSCTTVDKRFGFPQFVPVVPKELAQDMRDKLNGMIGSKSEAASALFKAGKLIIKGVDEIDREAFHEGCALLGEIWSIKYFLDLNGQVCKLKS